MNIVLYELASTQWLLVGLRDRSSTDWVGIDGGCLKGVRYRTCIAVGFLVRVQMLLLLVLL